MILLAHLLGIFIVTPLLEFCPNPYSLQLLQAVQGEGHRVLQGGQVRDGAEEVRQDRGVPRARDLAQGRQGGREEGPPASR